MLSSKFTKSSQSLNSLLIVTKVIVKFLTLSDFTVSAMLLKIHCGSITVFCFCNEWILYDLILNLGHVPARAFST